LEHTSQSGPDSGLGLSHFQYDSLQSLLSCSLLKLFPPELFSSEDTPRSSPPKVHAVRRCTGNCVGFSV